MGAETQAELELEERGGKLVARARGHWTVREAATIEALLADRLREAKAIDIVLDDLQSLDTAGAWLLYRTRRDLTHDGRTVEITGANPAQQSLLDEVAANDAPCPITPPAPPQPIRLLEFIGQRTVEVGRAAYTLLGFLGLTIASAGRVLRRPRLMRWTSLFFHMEEVGAKAMPIVGLMAFLIGIVIAQQGEFQLRQFGAELFVVNLLGVSILREIAILITAIMVAGRSGSAFTAQIGTMMLNEEVDAMRTLGIDPIEALVLPRLFAIVLLMPLLTFYADLVALLGGGIFCWLALDIPPPMFLERLRDAVEFETFLVGMVKAPFFAAVIAVVGCREGLAVRGGAESVGRNTTSSVVKSIFLVIVLDAAFAVFFSAIGV